MEAETDKSVEAGYLVRVCERDTVGVVKDGRDGCYEFIVYRDHVERVRSACRYATAKAALTDGYEFAVFGCLVSENVDLLALRGEDWVSFNEAKQ